ncbi:hypothetical protein ACOSP7_022108 [Xanthoceras sorbifolium]
MIAFEAFDSHSENEIKFEISLEPIRVEYLKKPIGQLTFNNEAPSASPKNGAPPTTIKESNSDDDDSYEVDEETEEDSEIFSVAIPMVMPHFFKGHRTMIIG